MSEWWERGDLVGLPRPPTRKLGKRAKALKRSKDPGHAAEAASPEVVRDDGADLGITSQITHIREVVKRGRSGGSLSLAPPFPNGGRMRSTDTEREDSSTSTSVPGRLSAAPSPGGDSVGSPASGRRTYAGVVAGAGAGLSPGPALIYGGWRIGLVAGGDLAVDPPRPGGDSSMDAASPPTSPRGRREAGCTAKKRFWSPGSAGILGRSISWISGASGASDV